MRRLALVFLLALLAATGTPAPKRNRDDASSSSARKRRDFSNPLLPANVFRDKIRDVAVDVLRDPPRLRLFGANVTGNNRHIAEAVRTVRFQCSGTASTLCAVGVQHGDVQRLEALRDPDRSVPPYGVAYSVAVWDADIPPEFNEIVQEGSEILPVGTGFTFQSRHGMTWHRQCPHGSKNLPNRALQFGWPCYGGATVAAESATPVAKNCFIAYLPPDEMGQVRLENRAAVLRIVKDECLTRMRALGRSPIPSEGSAPSGPFPVNLTALSHCIFTFKASQEFLENTGLNKRVTSFKGVAVIPSYVAQGRDIGFSSPMGRVFFLDSGTSGGPWPFGPLGDLHLVYVATFPVL